MHLTNLTPFQDKTLNQLELEGKFLSIIKDREEKPTASIRFKGESLKAFPLRLKKTKMLQSPLLFAVVE